MRTEAKPAYRRHLLPLLVASFLAPFFFGGCEPQETTIRLTSRERIRIDTLVNLQLDTLRPILDSICATSFQSMVDGAVDSLLEVRRREEQKLRSRMQEEQ